MHSVQTRLWDPRPPSKHVSPFPAQPPSNLRFAHVTSITPAKRITFYKSGDSLFGGVRMAIHKRSFKCFDALLDDLSQKVPLPFGVRTVTTPRGTHTIKHLEQLQDGGCYLCSDRRYAKPINLELATKRPGIWYHNGRRPHRPEAPSTTPPVQAHLPYRQRRILLVKNSEPGLRRSIVLNRRSTRSLRAFLEEVSEVMQFHVRKLYTAEGRRIDSIQSLITSPGVLVCVGREAFSPMLINFIRKTSEEKLPGLSSKSPALGPRIPGNGARSPAVRSPPHGAQSRGSEYDEGHESKKNVNFGLETKKSIIHPRSDSSNRSARFSLSSEKSCGVFSQARPAIMNDDIEKRVLVNKDGSLSVEMRVRFRLQSDETLQWSTQIKKSPSLSNESCPLSQAQPEYLQHGPSESCSDPDSTGYECMNYNRRPLQCALEENHCPCCYQGPDHQFDLWENPAHSVKHPPVPPPHRSNHNMIRQTHSSSSSSSCNSRRVVRCRARLSQSPGGSGSDPSQMVQEEEEMCVTEQIEHRVEVADDGDTQVEVCRVSRCCSRTELVSMDNLRPHSGRSVEGEDENRPFSAISSSSRVLQSLKEDQDDEDDDLPPSASQCSHRDEPSPSPTPVPVHDGKPTSKVSACSLKSNKLEEREEMGSKALSEASSCCCGADQGPSFEFTATKSEPGVESATGAEDEDVKRTYSGLSRHTRVSASTPMSGASSVCPHCGGCKQSISSHSGSSKRSSNSKVASPCSISTPCDKENNENDDKASDASAASTQSNKTNLSNCGRCSATSNVLEGRAPSGMSASSNSKSFKRNEEERAPSATSQRSNKSHGSTGGVGGVKVDQEEERAPSAQSKSANEAEKEENVDKADTCSEKSAASVKSHKSSCCKNASPLEQAATAGDDKRSPSCLSVKSNVSAKSGKANSILSEKSTKSHESTKSGGSHRSTCSQCGKGTSPVGKEEEEVTSTLNQKEEKAGKDERAASALSTKSNKSNKSSKSAKEGSPPRSEVGREEERATSQMSSKEKVASPSLDVDTPESGASAKAEDEKRPVSAQSGRTASSAKSCQSNKKLDNTDNRSPSAASGKSHVSATSLNSKHSTPSPNQDTVNVPAVKSNGAEMEESNQEHSECAKSKSPVLPDNSHTLNYSRNPSSPNLVTINTPENADEEENETVAPESEAGKSLKKALQRNSSPNFNGQTLSPKRTPSPQTHSPKTPPASPKRSQSPGQHLQAGGDTRGPSSLSVHSLKSTKSGRSKCSCGAASPLIKEENKNEKDGESDGAPSFRSSSSNRPTKKSEDPEKPLSRASSGSVSLALPDDQDPADSDSGKSSISVHTDTKTSHKRNSPISNDVETTGSGGSDSSNENSSKTTSHNPIPTIETPGGGEDGGEKGEEQSIQRATSAVSVKSSRSRKSCCNCSVKSTTQNLEIEGKGVSPCPSVKSVSTKIDSENDRISPAMSGRSRVRSKSPASASSQAVSPNDNENQDSCRPAGEAKDKEDTAQIKSDSVYSQSPCSLRPGSTNSTQAKSKESLQGSKGNNSAKSECDAKSKKSSSQKNKSSSPCPSHGSKPASKGEACSESILSHSLSAADLLKETMAARQNSQLSKTSKTSEKPRSERSDRSGRSRNAKTQEVELTPACLPNASPNEVVSDWLRSIPADTSLLALSNDLNDELEEEGEKETQEQPVEAVEKEEIPAEEREDKDENVGLGEEVEKEDEVKEGAAGEEKNSGPGSGESAGAHLSNNWHCSAAVMKVLLSSSPGRCRSLPEVSPVYGRRLSTSAKGLLDCLAQLQLIEPAINNGSQEQKNRKKQYDEIMAILQSLWLTEPRDIELKKSKDGDLEQATPPMSSSGVGMSSGSGGSGKDNGNQAGDESPAREAEGEVVPNIKEEDIKVADGEIGTEEEKPEAEKTEKNEEQNEVPESPKNSEIPSSLDKNSTNNSSKSATDNERETLEGSPSETPPTNAPRAPLSKKPSQDPDPVWVLNLLKKLEKQFMTHYIDAMAEFKVRWELDDSIILDTMISELKEEVSRRIQNSIQREMRKIQSRAGKGGRSPRPPQLANISRDSTMTEKRRRMLKVMKNQSVKTADSVSDEETAGEFSDQRSEDEYCPCDACVRKKMAARPFKTNPLAAEAPMMMEFDLLKILQLKKSPGPAPQPPEVTKDRIVIDDEGRNLEVVREEEEEDETKEDIKADVVLEETIPEEDEEAQEKSDGDTGEEEQEEEGTNTEEAETSENEAEECTCGSAREEDDGEEVEERSSNGVDEEEMEGEQGAEEEESDMETVKERSLAEGEEEPVGNKESTLVEKAMEGNVGASADDENDGTAGGESHEEEEAKESEEQEQEAENQTVSPTKEETDSENSAPEETKATRDAEEKESSDEGNHVEASKPDTDSTTDKKEKDSSLLHQFTKTSVESQPGSMEEVEIEPARRKKGVSG